MLVFATTIIVEMVKGLFRRMPTNIVAFVVALIVTVLAVWILCTVLSIPAVSHYIVGAFIGFDKFKTTWERLKAMRGK